MFSCPLLQGLPQFIHKGLAFQGLPQFIHKRATFPRSASVFCKSLGLQVLFGRNDLLVTVLSCLFLIESVQNKQFFK